ncbi:unnamed protein product [Ranitomeya imitator]|uniref:Reverse transcriptase domain-containing protein n=1 Tax=Ranitomeya imitator TaxID=111125 RepID=A0ABN9MC46_9NEOB|nr:unnamed protein product [Ranitomeya imitator]
MREAIVVVIPKADKDPQQPESYRPISLLTADIKILAKALANRLSQVIDKLIHPDQSGFMPNKSTAINLRRLFLNMQIPADNAGKSCVVSLDAHKAFDCVEWSYLWSCPRKRGKKASKSTLARWIRDAISLLYSSDLRNTMATRDGYKDSGSQLPCITGTGMGAGKHGNSSSYTVWQTPQMSVKPLIRASASHVTQIVSSLPEGIPEHADDFCKASGSSSAHPIRSQIIPMAHVVPSTIVTSSKSRISVLPAESSEDGSPYAPPAEPSAIEDHRKFEMPNIEPTMNQSALLNTLCVDGRFELPTADMGRSVEQYKTLPESREIGGGELTHRVICPPSNLRCHSWQPDSCSSQPAAAEYNSWRLQQQCTDNMRMQKLQFVSDYSAPMYAAGLHPIPIEWERVVKASDNIIMEKEIILERDEEVIPSALCRRQTWGFYLKPGSWSLVEFPSLS